MKHPTDEEMVALADKIVDEMEMDELVQFMHESLMDRWEDDPEEYQRAYNLSHGVE